ncbi:hypothetical protein CWD94_12740 [Lysinibacillus xylanilyticus]|uniref:Uncharacterized protein n=2 Tax=Lysinibacillus xylanilyticus TaxID=582475 RepID=A0A2M9Q5Q3_9BACI|nr:hypothetical protein CWD94_12740 [Lysinibacillus xylanilyticus]
MVKEKGVMKILRNEKRFAVDLVELTNAGETINAKSIRKFGSVQTYTSNDRKEATLVFNKLMKNKTLKFK